MEEQITKDDTPIFMIKFGVVVFIIIFGSLMFWHYFIK